MTKAGASPYPSLCPVNPWSHLSTPISPDEVSPLSLSSFSAFPAPAHVSSSGIPVTTQDGEFSCLPPYSFSALLPLS